MESRKDAVVESCMRRLLEALASLMRNLIISLISYLKSLLWERIPVVELPNKTFATLHERHMYKGTNNMRNIPVICYMIGGRLCVL